MSQASKLTTVSESKITIDSSVFGSFEVEPSKLFLFKRGIPGLEWEQKFTFVEIEEYRPLVWMISENGEYHFPVIPLALLTKDDVDDTSKQVYLPRIQRMLDARKNANAYIILKLNKPITQLSLKAPVIVDVDRREGEQLVLDRFQLVETYE